MESSKKNSARETKAPVGESPPTGFARVTINEPKDQPPLAVNGKKMNC